MLAPEARPLERCDRYPGPYAARPAERAGCRILTARRVIMVLLAFPALYGLSAYVYLAFWHGTPWLCGTVMHENGRLTLAESLFYFDHFLACVPMILLFALCVAGGFALGAPMPGGVAAPRARFLAANLLLPLPPYLAIIFSASVQVAGWQRTLDYSFQFIERDGVLSPGGNWNQLQLSNIPIALGTIAAAFALARSWSAAPSRRPSRLAFAGIAALALAFAFAAGLSVLWWPGRGAALNPRWLAHSIREQATYPLTAIPIALACILATHAYLARQPLRSTGLTLRLPLLAVVFFGLAIILLAGQVLVLRHTDVLALAQKPAFAPEGLSVAYLLASHVFEHFLDFVFIGPLVAGMYALLVRLAARRGRGV